MTFRKIEEFCPPGMQIKTPGGLSFRLEDITALVANGNADQEELVIYLKTSSISVTFYRNVDGGPPSVYELKRNIEEALFRRNTR